MPLPLPVKILLVIYNYLAPYLGKDSKIKTWIVKNKILTILFVSLLLQLFIIVVVSDQLFESNKQIVIRNNKITELRVDNEHLTDKNTVLVTVLDRLATGPLDELKSTEAVPLPESEIKTPTVNPLDPSKPTREDPTNEYVLSSRRNEDLAMEGY